MPSVVIIAVVVSISLVADLANDSTELLTIGIQFFRRAPDKAVVSVGRIVVRKTETIALS